MELKTLRIFTRIAESGSLTRAATALGIAQSALSRHLSELEQEFGGRLFFRTGRGVLLTELGESLMPRAQALLLEADQFMEEARAAKRKPGGVVNLGLIPSLSQPLIGMLLTHTRAHYPDIRLRVFEGYSGEIEAWLANGKIDAGIYNRYRAASHTARDVLLETNMMLVTAADSALAQQRTIRFTDLARIPLALPVRPNSLRGVLDGIAQRHGVSLEVVLEADSGVAIKDAIRHGGLHSILPAHAASAEISQGMLKPIRLVGPVIRQTVLLDISRQRPTSAATRQLLKVLPDFTRQIAKESASRA
ncbi:LysR family transcriptional regulator [Bordetella petrii]|uniref:LysR family transcriptional regulator n=1 Tax=Bordetella petrii TaxID=94624 RepID=UPI001E3A9898|nr:LysR family transcriptional regulator [Bordetella petrii]MCD0504577.1 LysR family transcriptional regulator [Bordetella petrii]